MPSVQAWGAPAANKPLVPMKVERRDPRPHDVVLDVLYCGICHSDIHQARDEWGGSRFPMVPGHEIVGRVAQLGSAVTRFKVDDVAGVGCMVDSCRTCRSCTSDLEQYCAKGMAGTYNSTEMVRTTPTYGGYSARIVVDERFVLRVPPGLDPAAAAPLLCAGITTYSPLRQVGVKAGDRVVVTFGGAAGSTLHGDTWVLETDGSAPRWTQKTTANAPAPRRGVAMAYYAPDDVVVLHGGANAAEVFGDVWALDATDWTASTATPLPPLFEHAMVYDEARATLVLFGGRTSLTTAAVSAEVWERSASGWANVTPATAGPAGRHGHVMWWDPRRERVMLFGGMDGAQKYLNDLWEWDGVAWTRVVAAAPFGATGPAPRANLSSAYDPQAREAWLMGGGNADGYPPTDFWKWLSAYDSTSGFSFGVTMTQAGATPGDLQGLDVQMSGAAALNATAADFDLRAYIDGHWRQVQNPSDQPTLAPDGSATPFRTLRASFDASTAARMLSPQEARLGFAITSRGAAGMGSGELQLDHADATVRLKAAAEVLP